MKKTLYIGISVLTILAVLGWQNAWAINTGYLSPETVVTTDASGNFGTVDWVTPDNAKSSDDNYSTVTLNNEKSRILYASNFGFSIPLDATINGIVVSVEGKVESGTQYVYYWVSKTAPTYGGNGVNFSTTELYRTSGSSTTLWIQSWTPSDINSSNFGVSISSSFSTPITNTIYVDHIRVDVYYTEASVIPSHSSLISSNTSTFINNASVILP
jgi:hypothetical protein